MVTRVFKSGNYIILDDGVNEPDPIPTNECRYSVKNSEYAITDNKKNTFSEVIKYVDIRNEAGSNYTNEAAFVTFLRENTGSPQAGIATPTSYGIEVGSGNITGESTFQLVGRNPEVGEKFEDIWDGGALSFLSYDNQTSPFLTGSVITGAISTATAIIVVNDNSGTSGVLTIRKIDKVFLDDEVISDASTGSADVDGVITPFRALSYPTAGEQIEIVCEAQSDTSSGSGARTILFIYLDTSFIQQSEIISLNGATPVLTTATNVFRFISLSTLTFGLDTSVVYGKTNTGTILARNSANGLIRGMISYEDSVIGDAHGKNNSLDSHFTVPSGKTAFPMGVVTNVTKGDDATVVALARAEGDPAFLTLAEMGNFQNSFILDLSKAPVGVPEKTDIKFIARSTNEGVGVVIELFLILKDS